MFCSHIPLSERWTGGSNCSSYMITFRLLNLIYMLTAPRQPLKLIHRGLHFRGSWQVSRRKYVPFWIAALTFESLAHSALQPHALHLIVWWLKCGRIHLKGSRFAGRNAMCSINFTVAVCTNVVPVTLTCSSVVYILHFWGSLVHQHFRSQLLGCHV